MEDVFPGYPCFNSFSNSFDSHFEVSMAFKLGYLLPYTFSPALSGVWIYPMGSINGGTIWKTHSIPSCFPFTLGRTLLRFGYRPFSGGQINAAFLGYGSGSVHHICYIQIVWVYIRDICWFINHTQPNNY